MLYPSYLSLYQSGELERRARRLEKRLSSCELCPRHCGVNRNLEELGFCRTGSQAAVAAVNAHHGEEPVLSGSRGSGTVFFANCNLNCVYCQNHQISQPDSLSFAPQSPQELAHRMLELQHQGCHNINLVSPSHVVPQIVRALVCAVPLGLRLPLVYNTGGYDSPETLAELDGIIDIYLPDLRYGSGAAARKYSQAADYVGNNQQAIREMFRQVGILQLDEAGLARKGLIVRHLVLPHGLAGSKEALEWLAQEVSPVVFLSVMSQYYPAHRAGEFPELGRPVTEAEYNEVEALVEELGFENGWVQQLDSSDYYRPDFLQPGDPFGDAGGS